MALNNQKILNKLALWAKWLVSILLIVAIWVAENFPLWIENNYSTGLYVIISAWLRILTGWIPFSLGDILYILASVALLVKTIVAIRSIIKNRWNWNSVGLGFLKLVRFFMWIYIVFNILWGLNYSRLGIAHQLQLNKYKYSKQDVTLLTNDLIDKVNACRRAIKDTALPEPSLPSIFNEAKACYKTASANFTFLSYQHQSIKISLYSPLGNYFGFTGYYNPFSGESQVRSDVPRVLIPYIACHEMAHQLGYASESEANFVGYLAASSSADVYFRYSVYLDLFDYAQREEIKTYIIDRDTSGLKNVIIQNRKNLDSLVKNDRKKIRQFFFKRQNNISPIASNIYDQYLKMNKQMAGINSYNEVIGWLLAYRKKYGKL